MQGSIEWVWLKYFINLVVMHWIDAYENYESILWIWIHKYGCKCCDALHECIKIAHAIFWITNGWNDELMTILEPFQELLWMQDSKCMKRVVMIDWLSEMLYGRARWYNDTLVKFQVDCLGHGNVGKTMTKAKIYHAKEPNLMRRVSWLSK